jgi:hypothetical protein|tara:strand:+ start:1672 stop:1875 length:204 start_codon:yes stop_codon:yes gene_type:complete
LIDIGPQLAGAECGGPDWAEITLEVKTAIAVSRKSERYERRHIIVVLPGKLANDFGNFMDSIYLILN